MEPHSAEFAGHLEVLPGKGGLTKLQVKTPWSTAEIYLHGAHVTHFGKAGEPPLLFMSEASDFLPGKPIRGGIPVIFPWFGPREGQPAHGFARTREWHLKESHRTPEGGVTLDLNLSELDGFDLDYRITVSTSLSLELTVRNSSANGQTIENCLHTYFAIADIATTAVTGLQGTSYFDKLTSHASSEISSALRIDREVDRIYDDSTPSLEVHDTGLARKIVISKSGSASTVVWNPWIEKSKRMADFGEDEYLRMICVESGNVADREIHLAPGSSHTLRVELSSVGLT